MSDCWLNAVLLCHRFRWTPYRYGKSISIWRISFYSNFSCLLGLIDDPKQGATKVFLEWGNQWF